ncbi:hypothetical protein Aau02nite_91570 [Amorphoplanes auranticolor]|uniref:Uncharacterized protein n=1 Tax=Actinoplanes auranticolor TaxID=47988 RepID=A0A919SXS3_9ACTN|nr:hypothetical protein Aau02nite_91570 [Actinoplanes auranticolor]
MPDPPVDDGCGFAVEVSLPVTVGADADADPAGESVPEVHPASETPRIEAHAARRTEVVLIGKFLSVNGSHHSALHSHPPHFMVRAHLRLIPPVPPEGDHGRAIGVALLGTSVLAEMRRCISNSKQVRWIA